MKSFFTSALLFISIVAFPQQIKILGRVIDATTNKAVKNANIEVYQTGRGTISNPVGYFQLIETAPIRISVSHVAYKTFLVDLPEDKTAVHIVVEPLVHSLEALSLKGEVFFQSFIYNQAEYNAQISRMNNLSSNTSFQLRELKCIFPGDIPAFRSYIATQIINGIEKFKEPFSATIAFTVTPEGTVAVDSVSGTKDQQASIIRQIFDSSPKWIPALQGQDKVAIHFIQIVEYDPKMEIIQRVDILPSFPGGTSAFDKMVTRNLKLPSQARNAGVKGKVIVSFAVNHVGEVEDIQVLKGLGYGCDEEVIRVIKLTSGKWIPGKTGGKPTKARVSVPVQF